MGVVDDVIQEPLGGAHRDHHQMAARLKLYVLKTLRELLNTPLEELIERRYQKYRRAGVFLEAPAEHSGDDSASEPDSQQAADSPSGD